MKKWQLILIISLLVIIAVTLIYFKATKKVTNQTTQTEEVMKQEKVIALMETSVGNIKLELDAANAPISVKNFVDYATEGFYNGTIFHRVIQNFMIQGGGFTPDFVQKETKAPIKNEARNGLPNLRGTIAVARTNVVDSATSQFFINVVDNTNLNHVDDINFGYAVFGKVTEGMDIADKIVNVPTTTNGMYQDVPVEPITIKNVKIIK